MAKILIMEDDAEQAKMLGELLKADGHHIETAYTGGEAWAILQTRPFDVLLTDMRVPSPIGTNRSSGGLALIVQIRRAKGETVPAWIPALRIIAISGAGIYAPGSLDLAGNFGADMALQKPVGAKDLLAAIEAVLT